MRTRRPRRGSWFSIRRAKHRTSAASRGRGTPRARARRTPGGGGVTRMSRNRAYPDKGALAACPPHDQASPTPTKSGHFFVYIADKVHVILRYNKTHSG